MIKIEVLVEGNVVVSGQDGGTLVVSKKSEETKLILSKGEGVNYADSLEKLQQSSIIKLHPTEQPKEDPAPPELTPEEKAEKKAEIEKKMADLQNEYKNANAVRQAEIKAETKKLKKEYKELG